MGSKSRIAKYIVPIIQSYVGNDKNYIEPFCGGCNVIDKIKTTGYKIASDENKYLIALFDHLKNGGKLPDEIPRELYNDVRANKDKYVDWYVGCVGFLASYNGRGFSGGYAKAGYEKTKNGERYRDYYNEAKNNILKQADDIQDITFLHSDYRHLKPNNTVIYCDPPYKNTKQYENSLYFNHDEFWDIMRDWSKDNIVIISELHAPDDFECIWQQEVSRSIKATDKSKAVEKLFKLK